MSGPIGNGPIIIPQLNEKDSDGRSRSSRRFIPLRQTQDPISMEIWMLQIVGDVLGERFEKVQERIAQHIRDMEREENGDR